MMHQATIGRNFETTLRLINDPRSEWYIEPARAEMDLLTLQRNAQALLKQTEHWTAVMDGANRRSLENLGRILDNQLAKLDAYNKLVEEKSLAAANPAHTTQEGGMDTPAAPPAQSGPAPAGVSPWLLIGGAALVLMLALKK